MKILLHTALIFALTYPINTVVAAPDESLRFTENKGQITDQFGNSRNDIDFKLSAAKGLNIFLSKGTIHYQWVKAGTAPFLDSATGENLSPSPAPIIMYRMDVTLIGANPDPTITMDNQLAYFERYYLPSVGSNGATAHCFSQVTYHNVYPNIDWVFYFNRDGKLEHDFIIRPGGKVADIKIQYGGATGLHVNQDGSLTATSPLGDITESAPRCYETGTKQQIASSFSVDGNFLSFKTAAHTGTLVIDPAIEWGTYYGGDQYDMIADLKVSKHNKVYAVGSTNSTANIATTGSHQVAFGGGVNTGGADAFVTCFNSNGQPVWATYYGGSGKDLGLSISCDTAGNIYFTGYTNSTSSIATTGSYQAVFAGDPLADKLDAFLVKLDTAGQRLWGTYLGGPENEGQGFGSVHCDNADNIYLLGNTSSLSGIASPGAFQGTKTGGITNDDIFLAKFKANGSLSWCTYYGGTGGDFGRGIVTDSIGGVFITGNSNSTSSIATVGSQQAIFGGGTSDAFLVKFDTAGQRIWGTYFGGSAQDNGSALALDDSSNVYLVGNTRSTAAIATIGSFQSTINGIQDAFLARFTNSGVLDWCSYYGGSLNADVASDVCVARNGSLYLTGSTTSADNIATPGSINPAHIGLVDGYIARFTLNGLRLWGSYFGGSDGSETVITIVTDTLDNIYFGGHTMSVNGIGSSGSYQPIFAGVRDGFLAKINDCIAPPAPDSILGPLELCAGSTQLYNTSLVNDILGYTWILPAGWAGSSDSNSISITTGGGSGTLQVAVKNYCTHSDTIHLDITIHPLPAPIINRTGNILSTTAAFDTYQWNLNGSAIPMATNPTYIATVNGNYSVTVSGSNGCDSTSAALTISDIVGIKELNALHGIKIYPNPATDVFTIELIEPGRIQLWDITGRMLKSVVLKAGVSKIDIGNLASGLYAVKVLSPEGIPMGSVLLVKRGN